MLTDHFHVHVHALCTTLQHSEPSSSKKRRISAGMVCTNVRVRAYDNQDKIRSKSTNILPKSPISTVGRSNLYLFL